MKRPEDMDERELMVKVAELCGWDAIEEEFGMMTGLNPNERLKVLPNYPADLNAMRDARRTLSPDQLRTYGLLLHGVLVDEMREHPGVDVWIYDATAKQEAIAFILTLEPHE